jgi:hypothetical protein
MDHTWQQLLHHLYRDGRAWVADLPKADWRRLAVRPGPVADLGMYLITEDWAAQQLLRGMSTPADVTPRKGFAIRPGKHSELALPVLVPFVIANEATPRLSLQLGMLQRDGDGGSFFGYRFESPEPGDEHNFFHSQPVKGFGHGPPVKYAVAWYPDRHPAFPLAATNAVELIAAMLVSFREWPRMVELTVHNQVPHSARLAVNHFMKKLRPQVPA